jgi:hypothetical protein
MTSFKRVTSATFACLLMLSASSTRAETIEPRKIGEPKQLRPGEGALLLSIRHQTPLSQTMHVRFVSATDPSRILKFERKVGLGGRTRMLERQVAVYAVPAGRWRLASHLAGCDETITPGQECLLTIAGNSYPLPSGVYPDDWFVIDVPAGGLTDADELSLEFPSDTVLGVPTTASVSDRVRSLRFKARRIPALDKKAALPFAQLTAGRVMMAEGARSAITCERPAQILKLFYNPFRCDRAPAP